MVTTRVEITLKGPITEGKAAREIERGITAAIRDVAQHGQRLVQEQLTPGHGVATGHLRRSVHGGLVGPLHAQIDAGLHAQGANVNYAEIVEGGSKPHIIRPKNKRALAFKAAAAAQLGTGRAQYRSAATGRLVFSKSRAAGIVVRSVRHPGTKGLFMFRNAANKLRNGEAARIVTATLLRRLNG